MRLLPLFQLLSRPTRRSLRFASTALAYTNFSDTESTAPQNSSPCVPEHHLQPFQVLQTLHRLHNHPSLALSFFTKLEQQGFPHSTSTYAAIIRILCYWGMDMRLDSLFLDLIALSEKDPSFEIRDVFEELLEGESIDMRPHLLRAFDGYVKSCVSLNMFDEAFDFLFLTRRRGILPSIKTCNFLINRLVEHGEAEMALAIFEQLKRLGLSPNLYTYTIVIKTLCKTLCKKDDLRHAYRVLLEEMKEAGVTPDSYCCATLIEGFCNPGRSEADKKKDHCRPDLGYDLLKKFRMMNAPIEVYAYTAVIRGFCNEMKLDEAESVVLDMKTQGLVPDVDIYSELIYGYCKSHNLDRAKALQKDMISMGIKTNNVIASYMLHCCVEMGRPSEVRDLFKEFQELGIFLDGVVYNNLFGALCELGQVDEAIQMLEELKAKHIDLDIKHYTTLIKGYFVQGDPFGAGNMLNEMTEKGFKPDTVMYNLLVAGFSRNGNGNASVVIDNILKDMEKRGVKPNSTTHKMIIESLCSKGKVVDAEAYFNSLEDKSVKIYSAMMNGYCEADLAKKSYELFRKFLNQGGFANEDSCFKIFSKIMYSKVLPALCQDGDIKCARSLFDFFVGREYTPDVVTYTIMINSYCRMNFLKEAHDLFQDMQRRGVKPDAVTYTVLIDGHIKTDNCQDAIILFEDMIDRGIEPDTLTYTAMISGLCNKGHVKKARALLNEMSSKGMTPSLNIISAVKRGIRKT